MDDIAENPQLFEIKLDLFDGPLDLLLHLVKQNELPIEKLSLAAVADQYLACIEQVKDFDIEVAGEYLVIAATLLSIKSAVLLNVPVEFVADDEGNLVDPHEELLRKLREAAIFRDSAQRLGALDILGLDVFAAPGTLDDIEGAPVALVDHSPLLLGKAFRKLLANIKEPFTINISFDRVSIVDRMMTMLDTLAASNGPVSFDTLIPDVTSRSMVIASFVAMLELCKRNLIVVKQDEVFDQIVVMRASEGASIEGLTSEFDAPPQDISANG